MAITAVNLVSAKPRFHALKAYAAELHTVRQAWRRSTIQNLIFATCSGLVGRPTEHAFFVWRDLLPSTRPGFSLDKRRHAWGSPRKCSVSRVLYPATTA